jgi:hypothetical protein
MTNNKILKSKKNAFACILSVILFFFVIFSSAISFLSIEFIFYTLEIFYYKKAFISMYKKIFGDFIASSNLSHCLYIILFIEIFICLWYHKILLMAVLMYFMIFLIFLASFYRKTFLMIQKDFDTFHSIFRSSCTATHISISLVLNVMRACVVFSFFVVYQTTLNLVMTTIIYFILSCKKILYIFTVLYKKIFINYTTLITTCIKPKNNGSAIMITTSATFLVNAQNLGNFYQNTNPSKSLANNLSVHSGVSCNKIHKIFIEQDKYLRAQSPKFLKNQHFTQNQTHNMYQHIEINDTSIEEIIKEVPKRINEQYMAHSESLRFAEKWEKYHGSMVELINNKDLQRLNVNFIPYTDALIKKIADPLDTTIQSQKISCQGCVESKRRLTFHCTDGYDALRINYRRIYERTNLPLLEMDPYPTDQIHHYIYNISHKDYGKMFLHPLRPSEYFAYLLSIHRTHSHLYKQPSTIYLDLTDTAHFLFSSL